MNKSLPNRFSLLDNRVQFIIIGTAWASLQIVLLYQFGIVTGFEAAKYIDQADLLIRNGSYSTNNFIFYSTEILLIAACRKLQTGYWPVIAIQLLCNAISVFCFYKLVGKFTARTKAAFWFTLLFVCMYYYQLYNVYLFTESLFFSLSVLFSYRLFSVKKFNAPFAIFVFGALILLSLTRPTGILFIPATIFFLILRFGKTQAIFIFWVTTIVGLIVFYFVLNAALGSGGEFDFLLPYIEEHIICGVPTAQQPNNLTLPVNKNSVEGLWHIITNNSSLYLRLARERFLVFWGVQRHFFSAGHNLFVAIYFYTLYLLILLGIRKLLRNHLPETIFMTTYIFLIMLTVLLSCDEWHNRFLYSIFPFLLIIGTGIWSKKNTGITN